MQLPYNDELERDIQRKVIAMLRGRGFWTLNIHGGPWQTPGSPDVLAVKDGRAYWFEVKRPGQPVTKLQAKTLEDLRLYGCVAEVVHSVAEVVACLG